jgi:hypothetical protein
MSMDAAVRPITRVRRSICWNIRYSRRSATAAIMRGRLMPLVNAMHRVLNRSGVRLRLHPVAAHPHTVAFGTSRVVPPNTTMVCFEAGQYSVPHTLLGETVWVRVHGRGADEQVIIVHVGPSGPAEVARHARATPGSPQVSDAHFPAQPAGALDPNPTRPQRDRGAVPGPGRGGTALAGRGRRRGHHQDAGKDRRGARPGHAVRGYRGGLALGHAAVHGRFAEADLASILDHHATGARAGDRHQAGEDRSLTLGTAAWAQLGQSTSTNAARTGEGEVGA